ncbi:MAG TPA: hypothetical protein VKS98_03490 [Chthoniobacterales bacterium]|nr:hypothetical protein [Chthoniobacterales bacterium]
MSVRFLSVEKPEMGMLLGWVFRPLMVMEKALVSVSLLQLVTAQILESARHFPPEWRIIQGKFLFGATV